MRTTAALLAAALGVAVLGGASAALAKPLDVREVDANAKLGMHIDFDALRASAIARKIEAIVRQDPRVQDAVNKIQVVLGMDITQDIHGVTFYTDRYVDASGVVLVRAKMDQPRLTLIVKNLPDYAATAYGAHELVTWTDAKGKTSEHSVAAAFHGESLILLGRNTDDIKRALDVLDGKAPSLAGVESPLKMQIPAGAVLVAAAINPGEGELPAELSFKSPLVRQCRSLTISLGEHKGEVFAKAQLAAKSEDAAGQFKAIIDGSLALAKLQQSSNPDAMDALQRIDVEKSETTIRVQWQAPVELVVKLATKAWQERQKKDQ